MATIDTSYRVEMFTRSSACTAGERLSLEGAERLARQEQARPGGWGQVRIVEVRERTLRVLKRTRSIAERAF